MSSTHVTILSNHCNICHNNKMLSIEIHQTMLKSKLCLVPEDILKNILFPSLEWFLWIRLNQDFTVVKVVDFIMIIIEYFHFLFSLYEMFSPL